MSMPPHAGLDYQAYNAAVDSVIPAERTIDRTTGMTFVDPAHLDELSQQELGLRAAIAICGP